MCRPPRGNEKMFKKDYKTLIEASKGNWQFYFVGDINLNLHDYKTNSNVKNAFNVSFNFDLSYHN